MVGGYITMNDSLMKLKELTRTLTSNSYLTDQAAAWEYAFNSVTDLVCITGTSCQIKFLNTSFLKKLTFGHDFYINRHIDIIFSQAADFNNMCDDDTVSTVCYGERFFPELGGWFIGKRYPIQNSSSIVIGYTFMFSDITAKKCAEAKFQVSEARFTDLFKNMPVAAAVFLPIAAGEDFKIVDFNQAAENLEGIARESIVGRCLSDLQLVGGDRKLLQSLKNVFITGEVERLPTDFYQDVFINGWRDVFLMKLPSGEVVSLYTDETFKVESQLKIKSSQKLLQGMFDSIPDIIGLQDLDHNALRYNKAALNTFNVTTEELKTKKCYELLGRKTPCDVCNTQLCKITKKPEQSTKFIEELGGWYDCRSYPIFDESGEIFQVIEHLRDITDLVDSQIQREVYYEALHDTLQRLQFIINTVNGYVWEKRIVPEKQELIYSYIDSSLCKDFFKLESYVSENNILKCTNALGKTATELVNNFYINDQIKSFIEVFNIADAHCLEKGTACDYFEMGYMEDADGNTKWLVLHVRKKPTFDTDGNITGLIGFADNCSNDMHSIHDLIVQGIEDGTIIKLADNGSAKVYWIAKHKEEKTDLAYNDFP